MKLTNRVAYNMQTNKHLLIICIIVLCTSCIRKNPYPGYTHVKHGIYYKLHKIGEETKTARPGDYITADITYKTMSDSIFFNGRRKLRITTPSFKGAVDECFLMLAEDECASFIISADDFFKKTLQSSLPSFFTPGSKMKVKIDVIDIQPEEEYNKEKKAFLDWIDDFGDYEKTIMAQYLAEEKLDMEPLVSGIYRLILKEGKGKRVEPGDTVTVNYEGRFLNGKYFDSTVKRNMPFRFVYGTEWQVVKGLEEAIGVMHEGERSLFIFPSEQAFGRRGSSTGIIPPYTSLLFEVELVQVN